MSVTSYLGSGTFVGNEFSNNPFFSQAISLAPIFAIDENLSLTGGFSVECEYTEPDSSTR